MAGDSFSVLQPVRQHSQRQRTVFFHPPAELLFDHEPIKDDDIGSQLREPCINARIIRLHRVRFDAQRLKVKTVLCRTRARSKADSIACRLQ